MYKIIVKELKLKVENTLKEVPNLAQQTRDRIPRYLNTDIDTIQSYYHDDGEEFIHYDSLTSKEYHQFYFYWWSV